MIILPNVFYIRNNFLIINLIFKELKLLVIKRK
ncbi:hypothetical protein CBNA_1885 [Coxiella burnetii str. Namibia]|nr:hypothetical protein CBNA_1885 [Coxiella burnetii str. Namibia]